MDLPRVTAFDGDDTLWHNETLFSMTQGQFQALLSRHADIPIHMLNARPLDSERRNIQSGPPLLPPNQLPNMGFAPLTVLLTEFLQHTML